MGIHGDSLQRVYPWVWRKWISPTGYVGIKAFVLGVMSLRSGFIWSVDPIANFDIYMLGESTVMVAANIFGTFDGNISFVKVVLCIFLLPLWVLSIKQIRVTSPNDSLVVLFWCFFLRAHEIFMGHIQPPSTQSSSESEIFWSFFRMVNTDIFAITSPAPEGSGRELRRYPLVI